MTVKELIDILNEIEDKDSLVMVDGYEYGLEDIERKDIQKIRVAMNVNELGEQTNYGGPHEQFVERTKPEWATKFNIKDCYLISR